MNEIESKRVKIKEEYMEGIVLKEYQVYPRIITPEKIQRLCVELDKKIKEYSMTYDLRIDYFLVDVVVQDCYWAALKQDPYCTQDNIFNFVDRIVRVYLVGEDRISFLPKRH